MNKLLCILISFPIFLFGQTYVPDSNFEAYLEANGMGNGTIGDQYVATANINTVTVLIVVSQNISDLTGIEDFTALSNLRCNNNQLTSLDVSNNTALSTLRCYNNQLTSLDVSNNTALTTLFCQDNQLTFLDISTNTALTTLYCSFNQLTSLDVSQNTALTQLNCISNQLTSLDVSNNTILTSLSCSNNQLTSLDLRNGNNTNISNPYFTGNPQLYCIDVDDISYSTANWSSPFSYTSFSTDCLSEIFGCTDTNSFSYDNTATFPLPPPPLTFPPPFPPVTTLYPSDIFCCYSTSQSPAVGQETFDINGINTELGPGGFMWDLSDQKYEVPKGGGKHSIFAHDHWMGGVDDGGQLRVAAMTYRQGGSDLWAGPIPAGFDPACDTNTTIWERVWKINKTQIDSHVTYSNSMNYVMPEVIESWPAHGDTIKGQAFYLAPFVDVDNNGIYNPFLGDYPQIKGDQALYMIRNDVGNIHGESEAAALGIEQHLMFYGYLCIDNPAVNHTLFVNMKIFNRGNHNINDFYLGTWLDPDLGNYLDDYVGCNVEKDLGYVYNGDADDEGASGYSSSGCQSSTELPPPAQGLVYLNQSMSKFMYFNNDGSVTGNPGNGQDFYNYLRGIWRDNVPMTFGGDGHGSGTGTTTDLSNYMFPGTTDPAFPGQDWSETTAQNFPADRRFIMSAGPVDLNSGDVYTLDYAFVFAWDSITPGNTGSVNLLFEYVDTIKAVYQNPGILSCNNPGCTDLSAVNYNPTATLDDGSCCYTGGCKDITAINYDANALCDDGSCNYVGVVLTRLEGTGNGGVALEMIDQSIDDIFNSTEHRVLNPTYKKGKGPVVITIVDSIINYPGKYLFRLDDPVYTTNSGGDQTGLITSYGGWSIIDSTNTNVIYSSNQSLDIANKEYVPQLGISISIGQQLNPGADPINPCNTSNSLISLSSSLEFDDQNDKWLSGVPDRDDPDGLLWGLNWIRSGSYIDDNNALLSDYNLADDPNGVYETAVVKNLTLPLSMGGISYNGGTWAPYSFASDYTHGPGFKLGGMHSYTMSDIEDLPSVDIVFTDDVTKWSRVCIVEAQDDPLLSVGGKLKMELRDAFSVDINGNADLSGTFGMGWFPGYAIDIETGERLNIIFSEDSWLTSENGNDMLWNPTSNVIDTDTNYLLGGKHFIYVLRGESWVKGSKEYLADPLNNDKHSPNYDEGKWIYRQLSDPSNASGRWNVFKNVTWVGVPLLKQGSTINLSNKATVKLRVKKPYKQYETVSYNNFFERSNSSNPSDANDTLNFGSKYTVAYINSTQTWGGKKVVNNGSTYLPGDLFSATDVVFSSSSNKARVIEHESLNSFNPLYSFIIPNDPLFTSTDEFDQEGQLGDLFKVNIYPNPTRQRINISFSSTESQDIEFKIVNNMGQILFSKNLKQFKGDYLKEVLLDKYSKGIYYFHIKTNEGAINKKVIYQ